MWTIPQSAVCNILKKAKTDLLIERERYIATHVFKSVRKISPEPCKSSTTDVIS